MCQMSVFLKKKNMDSEEKVAENAALLQMTEAGAVIISLFDESRTFAGVQVQQIDFLKGKVVLEEVDR